jgi:hypothetical protein
MDSRSAATISKVSRLSDSDLETRRAELQRALADAIAHSETYRVTVRQQHPDGAAPQSAGDTIEFHPDVQTIDP